MWKPHRQGWQDHTGEFVPFLPNSSPAERAPMLGSALHQSGNFTASNLRDSEADHLRFSHGIRVEGEHVPAPVASFEQLGLPQSLLQRIASLGITHPTAVQMQSLPCQLAGRDIIAISETGSGKTLAFSLPLAAFLAGLTPNPPGASPRALVLLPGRELTFQVQTEISLLLAHLPVPAAHAAAAPACNDGPLHMHGPVGQTSAEPPHQGTTAPHQGFRAVSIYGGVPIRVQAESLKGGVDVLVSTLGRLLDFVERGFVSLDQLSHLILDEADMMIAKGMESQLRQVFALLSRTQRTRQTSLWSATLPDELERLARSAVVDPVTIRVGYPGLTARGLQQNVHFVHHYQKPKRLLDVLRQTARPPVLVFCSTREEVDEVATALVEEQFHAAAFHSGLEQSEREAVLDAFRNDQCDVMVATDVASRGVNIPAISHVINYTLPQTIEDYIHRCGRTGRMGVGGETSSFLTLDCKIAAELRDTLIESKQEVPVELSDIKQFGKRIIITEFGDRPANS